MLRWEDDGGDVGSRVRPDVEIDPPDVDDAAADADADVTRTRQPRAVIAAAVVGTVVIVAATVLLCRRLRERR